MKNRAEGRSPHERRWITRLFSLIMVVCLVMSLSQHSMALAANDDLGTGSTQDYSALLDGLSLKVEEFKKLSADTEGYEDSYDALCNALDAYEASLGQALSSGEISEEEYNRLFTRFNSVLDVFFAEVVPEEEAVEYVALKELQASLADEDPGSGSQLFIAVRNDGALPGEPSAQSGSKYLFFKIAGADDQGNPTYTTTSENQEASKTIGGIISSEILNADGFSRVGLNNNSNYAGLVDHSGVTTGALLPGIDWDNLLEALAATKKLKVDGVTITADNMHNYRIVCYVIKYQSNSGGTTGWHVDCTVVPKSAVTLSYNMNMPSGYTIPNLTGLDAQSGVPYDHDNNSNTPHVIGFSIKSPLVSSSNVKVGDTVTVKDANDKTATFQFLGWRTTPGSSGTLYAPGDTLQISSNTTLYAAWSNNLEVGDITVKKQVVVPSGVTAPSTAAEFSFTVSGISDTYNYNIYNSNGTQASSGTVANNGSFSLKDTQYAVIKGLPKDTNVTVTEAAVNLYAAQWTGGTANGRSATIKVVGGSNEQLTCTNTYNPDVSLTVTKTVSGSDAAKADSFSFSVYLNGSSTAASTFTLSDGGSNTISIPYNAAIRVVEDAVPGYSTSSLLDGSTAGGSELSFTATNRDGHRAAFTNTENTADASFVIAKTLDHADTADHTYTFNVALVTAGGSTALSPISVTVPAGETGAQATYNLPQFKGSDLDGQSSKTFSYQISEVGTDDDSTDYDNSVQTVTVTLISSEGQLGAVASPSSVSFNNTLLGALQVSKTVVAAEGSSVDANRAFDIKVTLPDGDENISLKHSESESFTRLPIGSSFSVEELAESAYGYAVSYTNGEGQIVSGTTQVTVTNTELSGQTSLDIIKNLHAADSNDNSYSFSVVQVLNAQGEAMADGYSDTVNITVPAGETRATGTLTLSYTGAQLDGAQTKDFYYQITENGESGDTLIKDESSHIVKVTLSHDSGDVLNAAADVESVSFTNILLGQLEIEKQLVPSSGGEDGTEAVSAEDAVYLIELELKSEYFAAGMVLDLGGEEHTVSEEEAKSGNISLNLSLAAGSSVTVKRLPYGTEFTVAEAEESAAGYSVSYSGETGTVSAGTAKATVTNTELSTTLIGLDGNEGMKFTKFLTNPDGESHKYDFLIEELDASGAVIEGGFHGTFSVDATEKETELRLPFEYCTEDLGGQSEKLFWYRITESTEDDGLTIDADESVYIAEVKLSGAPNRLSAELTGFTVDGEETQELEFSNTLLSSLTIKKTIVGAFNGDPAFEFTIELDKSIEGEFSAALNGIAQAIVFEDGKATVSLGDKDELVIFGLPQGADFTVTEANTKFDETYAIDDGARKNGNSAKGVITPAGAVVDFHNYSTEGLPQTGQTNWPVPVLLTLGLMLCGTGFAICRPGRKKHVK